MPQLSHTICVNHVGFLPPAFKSCVVVEPPEPEFEILELRDFFPLTPQIPGAVSVGLTPHSFEPESYGLDNEYDMPVVGWTLWLLTELAAAERVIR